MLGSAPAVLAAPEPPRAAEPARLADRSLLTAIAAAGERLVAVGDRGIIVFSDDGGRNWSQAASVPTQALLTGVCFLDAQHGIAVGHDLVALASSDAGRTWQRTHYAPEAQRPLLDVWCGSDGRAIAIGAYSTYLSSADAGVTWSEQPFTPAPAARGPWRQGRERRRRTRRGGRGLSPEPHRRRERLATLHRRRSRAPVPLG